MDRGNPADDSIGATRAGVRVAAVLFTDVVGSTARDRRLGPERADREREAQLDATAAVVERRGGRVVKALGDGQLCLFESASSALDAAVEIQQVCALAAQAQPDPLLLRIGISAGEIRVDGGGDCHGTPVVEASRLCAEAGPRQVLVSDLAQRLGGSAAHPMHHVGARSLKGLRAPVDVWQVEWRGPVEGRSVHLGQIDADPHLRDRAATMLDQIGGDPHMRRVRARLLELLDLRPGQAVLDVGCGTGDDVFVIAQLVGDDGRVVGVDLSETMIAEATARAQERGCTNVDFLVADACALELPDASFDAARSDRLFQYLLEPVPALQELRRVLRPGGRLAIAETDWETAVLDPGDDITARVNQAWVASRPNGRAGQQLYRLCREAGLLDVAVEGLVQTKTELDTLYREGVLPALAAAAVDRGAITSDEAGRWLARMELAGDRGTFFRAFTTFIVHARS